MTHEDAISLHRLECCAEFVFIDIHPCARTVNREVCHIFCHKSVVSVNSKSAGIIPLWHDYPISPLASWI